jgi:glycosyltransferase involved in cell wall biosynthesis
MTATASSGTRPSATIALAVLDEEPFLERTLRSVVGQDYPNIVEILVADGGSSDRTREIATSFPKVRVLDNDGVRQAAGLNRIIDVAAGEIIVRVDGHCELAPDYVSRCVDALDATGAAMVGGAMRPLASRPMARAVADALSSGVGAGPARFHTGGDAGWVDTVYLGAYRTDDAREVGGYSEDQVTNEDAEFAFRMSSHGGVWFDPAIRSTYTPRDSLAALARQFHAYGRGRAATVRKHPESLRARQLAAPALLLGLASPWRKQVAVAYAGLLVLGAARARREGAGVALRTPAVMATMHLAWGAGMLRGFAERS